MNMKQLFGSSGNRESDPSTSRRFHRQSSIPKFILVGDMIRPVPMEGVIPHRRVGERPPGPLFEARVAKQPEASVGKRNADSKPTPQVVANPFSRSPKQPVKTGLFSRTISRIASVFKRDAGGPQASAPGIQAELRLDAVKPLRNELSDSDSEVVEPQAVPPVPILVSGMNGIPEATSAQFRIGQPSLTPAQEIAPPAELLGKP